MSDIRTSYVVVSGTAASASGIVVNGECWLAGYNCGATSSGTITLYDALSATGTAKFAATPSAGSTVLIPNLHFTTGLYCTVGGTSITATFFKVEQ
jgi:hypothetical protein